MTTFTSIPKQVEEAIEKWDGQTSRRDFLKTFPDLDPYIVAGV